MIVRDGSPVSFPVLFNTGFPDAAVAWSLRDNTGSVLTSGSITPTAGAISIPLPVSSTNNILSGVLTSYRDLSWSYTTGGSVVADEVRYTIEARVPFGASVDGVRTKLGVIASDLPDQDISLVRAYMSFQTTVGAGVLAASTDNGGPVDLAIRDALEALAALAIIPTMAVRVATKESSGTDSFSRQDIDWGAVGVYLDGLVNAGILAVNVVYDPTANFTSLLVLAVPSVDPFTGGSY